MCKREFGRRGQVAIFTIVALVIVGIIIGVVIYPRLKISPGETVGPESYLRDCIEPDLKPLMKTITSQGGFLKPEGFVNYQNRTPIKFLCYSSENYKPCVPQVFGLRRHIEGEIRGQMDIKVKQCISSMKEDYESRGYSVSLGEIKTNFEIMPGKMVFAISAPMTITKDVSQTFKKFEVKIPSQYYDLIEISDLSIIPFESTLGDSETTSYMSYYPDLKIQKQRYEDGVKIYTLTNVVTKEEFSFATRSLVWPPGYGL